MNQRWTQKRGRERERERERDASVLVDVISVLVETLQKMNIKNEINAKDIFNLRITRIIILQIYLKDFFF
jgi:hypothetical protein